MARTIRRMLPHEMTRRIIDLFHDGAVHTRLIDVEGAQATSRYRVKFALNDYPGSRLWHATVTFVVPLHRHKPVGVIVQPTSQVSEQMGRRLLEEVEAMRRANVPALLVAADTDIGALGSLPLSLALPLMPTLPAKVMDWAASAMDETRTTLERLAQMVHMSPQATWVAQVGMQRATARHAHAQAFVAVRNKPRRARLMDHARLLNMWRRRAHDALTTLKGILSNDAGKVEWQEQLAALYRQLSHYPLARNLQNSIARIFENGRVGVLNAAMRECSFAPLLLGRQKSENASDARWDVARCMVYMSDGMGYTQTVMADTSLQLSPAAALLAGSPACVSTMSFNAHDWVQGRMNKVPLGGGAPLQIARRAREDKWDVFIPVIQPIANLFDVGQRQLVHMSVHGPVRKDYLAGLIGEVG